MTRAGLARALRVLVLTDRGLCAPRELTEVVRVALAAGAGAVQLRNHGESARELVHCGLALREITRAAGALLFVNDRLDVALAVEADGLHLGPHDAPLVAVRAAAPGELLIGFSADEPESARAAARAGADYIGCGTVYPTKTKPDAGEVIGPRGLEQVVKSVDVPVVAIGGIEPARAPEVARTGAAGVAVLGAVMTAADPGGVVRGLLAPFLERDA